MTATGRRSTSIGVMTNPRTYDDLAGDVEEALVAQLVSRPGYGPRPGNEGNGDDRTASTCPVGASGWSRAMSATAARSRSTSPEKLERELLARLGLDSSATPEDLGNAHRAVSAYLAAAPKGLRAWARTQAAGADEAYALLTDPAALARAVALVGAGERPAVPPPAPVAASPVAMATPAAPASGDAARRTDENGRRIVSDDEIDALLAEVDPTARREVVGTAAERAASMAAASRSPRPNRVVDMLGSRAFRNLALVGATIAAIGIIGVLGFN